MESPVVDMKMANRSVVMDSFVVVVLSSAEGVAEKKNRLRDIRD